MVSSREISKMLEDRRKGKKVEKEPETSKTPVPNVIPPKSSERECEACGINNPPEAKFCVGCGQVLPEEASTNIDAPKKEYKICPNCHTKNKKEAMFCVACGRKFEPPSATPEPEKSAEHSEDISPAAETEAKKEEIQKQEPPETEIPEVKTVPVIIKEEESTEPSDEVGEEGIDQVPAEGEVDPVEKIKKSKELLDIGAITQEEFDRIKEKYLKLI